MWKGAKQRRDQRLYQLKSLPGKAVDVIAFDLACSRGHVFEGWFDSIEAFEQQKARQMVTCPYCEDAQVKRIMSPVALRRSPREGASADPASIDYGKLAMAVVEYLRDHFEDVGSKFAGEALKIHYGVSEKRNIRGTATTEEEKTLKDEGIEFYKVPFPAPPKGKNTKGQ